MTQSENMAQLEQLQALKATRDRVLEVKERMVPLVEQMAAEGDPLAKYLISELKKAEEAMTLANMDAHNFIEERTDG